MRRQPHDQRHTVIYENSGVEVARYSVTAETELAAELQTSPMFFRDHLQFDEFKVTPGLTFRIQTGGL